MPAPDHTRASLDEDLAREARSLVASLRAAHETDLERARELLWRLVAVLEQRKELAARPRTHETFEAFVGAVAAVLPSVDLAPAPDREVGESIRYGILRARNHHLVSQHDVCAYVLLSFVLGRNFHREPGAHAVLAAPPGAPGETDGRVERLLAWARDGPTAGTVPPGSAATARDADGELVDRVRSRLAAFSSAPVPRFTAAAGSPPTA